MTNALASLVRVVTVVPRIDKREFRSRSILVFALIVVLRSVTNIYAARFTLAIYVQLITLMTPFIVAGLSNLICARASAALYRARHRTIDRRRSAHGTADLGPRAA